jgi:hypothetical protein
MESFPTNSRDRFGEPTTTSNMTPKFAIYDAVAYAATYNYDTDSDEDDTDSNDDELPYLEETLLTNIQSTTNTKRDHTSQTLESCISSYNSASDSDYEDECVLNSEDDLMDDMSLLELDNEFIGINSSNGTSESPCLEVPSFTNIKAEFIEDDNWRNFCAKFNDPLSHSGDDDIELDDDFEIPKVTVNKSLIKLQELTAEFIASIICINETYFYNQFSKLDEKAMGINLQTLLCKTSDVILKVITVTTEKYYNDLFKMLRDNVDDQTTRMIHEMTKLGGYEYHILLDKLFRITVHAHCYEIERESLDVTNLDIYIKTILNQINTYLMKANFLHMMSKGSDDNFPLELCVNDEMPFKVDAKLVKEE